MSASSVIVTTALLAPAGENTARPQVPKANPAEHPKRLFADSPPLVNARSESGTDKVSGDAASKRGSPMTMVSGSLPEGRSGTASKGSIPADSMSPCRHDLPGGAVQGKGIIAVPTSTHGGQAPSAPAPARSPVLADPATDLKARTTEIAPPKSSVSAVGGPEPRVKGNSGIMCARGNASATSSLTEAQSDTTVKRDASATANPTGQRGVAIPKENGSSGWISRSSDKVEEGIALDRGVSKTVRTGVVSQTPADRRAPVGNPKLSGEKEIAAAELVPKPWSFGVTGQVVGPGTMTRPTPVPVAKAQAQTARTAAIPAERGPVPQAAGRTTPRQVNMQDSSAPLRAGLSEGPMGALARQAMAPAVTVPERASEPAKKMPASASQVTAARKQIGSAVPREASKMTPDNTQPKAQSTTADPAQGGMSANAHKTEDLTKSRSILPDHQFNGKLEKIPIPDKPFAPPHTAEPNVASRYVDNRHVNSFSREATARHAVNASANQTAGKEVDPSTAQDSIHAVPQFSAPEGAESAAVQRATVHIAAPMGGESASVKTPAQSVGEQILDSIRGSITRGEQQLSIRLRPPELGSVCVRFTERNDQIHAVLEVDRPDTRREIERALPDVVQSLHDAGVPIRRLEVTTGETPQREPGREQLQQGSWQQGSDRSRDEPQRAGTAGRSAYHDGLSQTVADSPETVALPTSGPADRIDLLM